MSGGDGDARRTVLDGVRRALKRANGIDPTARAQLDGRLSHHPRGPVPARTDISKADRIQLFIDKVVPLSATVARLDDLSQVPQALADYLKGQNLPPQIRLAPDPGLTGLDWDSQPLLEISTGPAREPDPVSLTGAFAGIAETGTLMLLSGENAPTTLNFLPETHVVVLKASQMVGPYEEAWDKVRARYGPGQMPRTVNFITGPSRTGDIEQTIQLGAHGPKRLHILLIDDDSEAGTRASA